MNVNMTYIPFEACESGCLAILISLYK